MTKEEQKQAIRNVKRAFKLDCIRPIMYNNIINKYGLLQICEYTWNKCIWTKTKENKRFLCKTDNANVLQHRWRNEEYKRWVIRDITHKGNEARNSEDVGYCLIEVIDANVLTKDEFNELYKTCKVHVKANDKLYDEIINAMLREITKDKESFKAWDEISFGFTNRIELAIWQGVLCPASIKINAILQKKKTEINSFKL